MKLAIMQPYFIPYIGYWQLMNAVDRFVIYDDVNFIKRGWINRNRILINSKPSYLTIPLNNASQNKKINEISMNEQTIWRRKMLHSITCAYRRSPYFAEIYPNIEKVILCKSTHLSDYLQQQLKRLSNLMDIKTEMVVSTDRYDNESLCGQSRIIDICQKESADHYINLEGGRLLYKDEDFQSHGIKLHFIKLEKLKYSQRKTNNFVPNLSILDLMMAVGPSGVKEHLCAYTLD